MKRCAGSRSGFTLLEVLVAIAILGLGMTAILSAQTGLFASSLYAEKISVATSLVRCKMSELEIKLSKEGYPLVDQKDEGPCCGDESAQGYRCKWKVEKVELPPPPLSSDLSTRMGGITQSLGSIGALASVAQTNGASLGSSPNLGDVSKLLAGQTPLPGGTGLGALGSSTGAPIPGATDSLGTPSPAPASTDFGSTPFGTSTSFGQPVSGAGPLGGPSPGMGGMGSGMGASSLAPLVMMLVYPTLKPMLEASIRKVTVDVEWKQGAKERKLEIVQLVTNPMQGGLDPNASQGLEAAFGALGSIVGGLTGGAAPGAGGPTK